jgi:hypothetical protein
VKGKGTVSGSHDVMLPESSNTQQIATMLYGEGGRMGQYTFAFEIASLLVAGGDSGGGDYDEEEDLVVGRSSFYA